MNKWLEDNMKKTKKELKEFWVTVKVGDIILTAIEQNKILNLIEDTDVKDKIDLIFDNKRND